MQTSVLRPTRQIPWNQERLTGQNPPLNLTEIWAIRTRLQFTSNVRELAMFNLALDSKLRVCDLTRLSVHDICVGNRFGNSTTVTQPKTHHPVQFEITQQAREAVHCWIHTRKLKLGDYLLPSRLRSSPHLSTRQYARIVHRWVAAIGLNDSAYGTNRSGGPRPH